jgi:high affinity sulfate transporter 1
VTLAAYGIPVSLAYASLAGLPPQYGVYGYLAGGLAYALFGSSRQLAIGPTSAISLLVGTSVAEMVANNPAHGPAVAALAALVTAGMYVIAWALRLSSLVNFISETILLGFKAGAALTIATTQLPKLFGVKGGGEGFFDRLVVLAGQLPSTRLAVLAFGVAAILVLLLGERFLPGRPVALGVVVLSILLLSFTSLGALGFQVVGALPRGLPHLDPPGLRPREVDGLIPLAFACLLLSYVESVSAARALAAQHREEIDPRQELLGLGAANLAAALFQSYPLAGGLSQSSVNDRAGARTPLSLVFASLTIGVCLMFLTGLIASLPNVVLAAIVLVAVKGLIDIPELRHLWRVSRIEFAVSMAAFVSVLVFGILKGVMLAVVISLLFLLRRASRPHVAFLGRIPGTRTYSDLERNPDNEPVPGMLIVRIEAALLYFNVEHVRQAIRGRLRSVPAPLGLLVIDLSSSPGVDVAGARMLATLQEGLGTAGTSVRLVGARASVRDILRAERLDQRVGQIDRRVTLADVVEEYQRAAASQAST